MGNISLHMHISLNSHNFPLREVLLFLFPTYRWENQTQWRLRISLKPDKPQVSEAMCSWAQNFPLYHAYFFLLFSLLFCPTLFKDITAYVRIWDGPYPRTTFLSYFSCIHLHRDVGQVLLVWHSKFHNSQSHHLIPILWSIFCFSN